MKRIIVALIASIVLPTLAVAADIRAYVAPFSVSPPEAAALKTTLQTLLTSRMSGEGFSAVATPEEADVIVNPSYTQLGKMFSLDAAAKLAGGKVVATVYEQGEGQDAVLPALGKMAAKLKSETRKGFAAAPAAPAQAPAQASAPARTPAVAPPPAPAIVPPPSAIQRPQSAANPDIERSSDAIQRSDSWGWVSQRITGAQVSLALAGNSADGRRLLVADRDTVHLYRQTEGKPLTLLAETKLPKQAKVLAVDCIAADGATQAVVTMMEGDDVASRIYTVENDKLKLVAKDLPYFFRAEALGGGERKLYAQEMGRDEDFYGDVYEATIKGGAVSVKNPIKMPRYGNVLNFNRFSDAAGKSYLTTISGDGYLVVYSDGQEIWRTSDKVGGSETFFQRPSTENILTTGEKVRWRFSEQRITVTDKGEIIVPQNTGLFVLGNQRSFSRYSVISYAWNGSSLEERWRTKQSQNYLADYFFAPESNELVLLEVVQKESPVNKGGSAIRVLRTQ